MEERILHSADLAPLLVADAGNGLALQQSVQQASANDPVSRSSEIAFVDLSVPDAGALLADLRAQQAAGRALEIVTIGADQDGLALIGRTLAGRSDITAVHVLAHGSDGVLQLGSARLDADSLMTRAADIGAWASALTADADLLLYGCDFAQSVLGQQMVRDLAVLTGADVAASTDLTGAAALGGNWTLEFETGRIEASVVTSAAAQADWSGTLAVDFKLASFSDSNSPTTSLSFSHNAISGNDRLLLVDLVLGDSASSASAVSFNGTALTFVAAQNSPSNHVRVEVWALVAPTVGPGTVNVTLSAATTLVAGATSYSGVDPVTAIGSVVKGSGNSATASVGVAAANGDMVVDVVGARQVASFAVGANQTQNFVRTQGTGAGSLSALSTREAGGASVTMSNDLLSADQNWASIAVRINQVAARLLADAPMDIGGNLDGSSSGIGWAGNWSGSGSSITLSNNSLADPSGLLPVSGGKARFQLTGTPLPASATATRDMATGVGADGTTTWISFLVQPDTGPFNFAGITFGSSSATEGFAGFSLGRFAVGVAGTAGTAVSGITPVNDQDALLVLRLQHAAGNDSITLYVNPTPGLNAPDSALTASASFDLGSFTRIAITGGTPSFGSNSGYIDELRVGRSYAEVAPTAAPVITSNGGGASASVSIPENTTAVTTVTAADYDTPTLSYSISGGADASFFQIDASSGVLRFKNAPDFESPQDAGANNVYDVIVRVSDGTRSDTQAIAVTVTDVASGPITVTTTTDVLDGDVSSVEALMANKGADGLVSLREAISAANNTSGVDTIILPSGTYALTRAGSENLNVSGDLDILDSLIVVGAGSATTSISAGGAFRVMDLVAGSLTMSGVTVRDGADNYGAGIQVAGGAVLTLTDVQLRGNSAGIAGGGLYTSTASTITLNRTQVVGNSAGSYGGGAYVYRATVNLVDTTVDLNTAGNWGGGLYQDRGDMTLTRVTVSNNTAGKDGAGVYVGGQGATTAIANSTVSGNSATNLGGGIYTNRPLTIDSSTIANNSASNGGGLYLSSPGSISIGNSIVADNAGGNSNRTLTSLGYNLDSGTSLGLNQASDISNGDARLLALADNGGVTRTHALGAGSQALDAGSPGAPATDQRGVARFMQADIGAYEADIDLNRKPVNTMPAAVSAVEDQDRAIAGLAVSDPNEAGTVSANKLFDATVSVSQGRLTVVLASGATISGGSNGSAGMTIAGSQAAINATLATLVYRANTNYFGNDTLTLLSRDGGDLFDIDTVAITVASVNDAPTGSDATVSLFKNASVVLSRGHFGFADMAGESDTFTSVVVQLPSAGNLLLDGVVLGAPAEVTVAQLDAGSLVFRPVTGAAGAPYATLQFQVRDSGGTANGGVDMSTGNTLRLDVVNRAPVIVTDGGGPTAAANVPENTVAVTTVAASDADGDGLVYSISGGADAARFTIDANSGALRFASAPNFEAPVDSDGNNVYLVTVRATDNNGAFGSQALTVTVTDVRGATGASTATLWFTTAGAQTSAAGGTTWSAGTVLAFGDAGDHFDPDGGVTNGSITRLAGFAAPVPLRGLHYVQTALTIGAAGTPFTLAPGDLLLVLDPGAGSTVTLDGTTFDRRDIAVFTPTVAGNYAAGTYRMLLDDGMHDGAPTAGTPPYDVHAITLVETPTTVGGTTLAAGSFVVAYSTPSVHMNIYTIDASSTGTGTTVTGDARLLLDGAALGIAADQIQGLHLLSEATAFDETVFGAGTLLVTVNGANSVAGVAGTPVDMFALSVTQTEQDAIPGTAASAALLFDGSDLGLTTGALATNSGNINGLTVITRPATNSAPALAVPLADQNATQDQVFNFGVPGTSFSDADAGDSLTYSALSTGGGALPAWLSFDAGTRLFSGTPLNADVGVISVRVTATDLSGASAFDDFTITVANVNDAPVLVSAIADQMATQDQPFVFVLPGGSFADIDAGDTLTYTAAQADGSALPAWLAFDAGTRTFSGTPANADVGVLQLRITATDSSAASASDVFAVTVADVNDPPTLATPLADQTAIEGSIFQYTIPAGSFADADAGDTLTYSASVGGGALPAWLNFDATTRTFSGTPGNADVRTLSVRVTATDGALASVSDDFVLTVDGANDAPSIAEPGVIMVTEDLASPITGISFADIDAGAASIQVRMSVDRGSLLAGPGIAISVTGAGSTSLTLEGSLADINASIAAGQILYLGEADATADELLRTTVDDQGNTGQGGAQRSTAFTVLRFTAVQDPPRLLLALADQNATQGLPFQYTVPAGSFGDVDVGDTLSYSATLASGNALPAWLLFDAATQTFSGTPTHADVGTLSVRVTATDNALASVSDDFALTVDNVNDAPRLLLPLADQNATQDVPFQYTIPAGSFGDVDVGDTLTYSATLANGNALPAWLRFDAATRSFSGTPANADVGTLSVRVNATDGALARVSDEFAITVANVNDAPVLVQSMAEQTVAPATELVLRLPAASFVDPDAGDTLHYAAALSDGSALPAWLRFDPLARSFSGIPTAADVGNFTIRVTATDDAGASAEMVFVLSVLAPTPAPALEAVAIDEQPRTATPAKTDAAGAPAPALDEPATVAAAAPAPAPEPELVTVSPAAPVAAETIALDFATSIAVVPQRQFTFDVASTLPVSQADTVLAAALLTQFNDIATSASGDMFNSEDLLRKLEELKRQMLQQDTAQQSVLVSSIALTSGLSIGYVVWLIRGGILVSSMLSALPAWQLIDPLPVLASARGNRGRPGTTPAEDPEVEKLFDDKAKAPPKAAKPPAPAAAKAQAPQDHPPP